MKIYEVIIEKKVENMVKVKDVKKLIDEFIRLNPRCEGVLKELKSKING